MKSLRTTIARIRGREWQYDPLPFWDERAADLIDTYDHPERWKELGWMAEGIEERVVPGLLHKHGVRSVLVIGAGSGRQYSYLEDFDVAGIDVSQNLVDECVRRHPDIRTVQADVAELAWPPVDAVLSSGTLQHVHPSRIQQACDRLKETAQKLIVVREQVRLVTRSGYQFPHRYGPLFAPWVQVHNEATDDRGVVRVELIAFRPPR